MNENKPEVGTETFSSENQVGTVQHLFALQIVFLSNKKKFPKIVIKHNEDCPRFSGYSYSWLHES
ncbi:MAG: hypothetical protein ACYCDX_07145 [Enterococcus faecalis]